MVLWSLSARVRSKTEQMTLNILKLGSIRLVCNPICEGRRVTEKEEEDINCFKCLSLVCSQFTEHWLKNIPIVHIR